MKTRNENTRDLELTAIRERLAGAQGRQYWRSLDELADTEEFQEYLSREFPENASEWRDGVSRRQFLKLMAASFAFAGLSACGRQPLERIVPYVRAPEQIVPGKPLFFASAMPLAGFANGVLVESHEGRPTKIEGNPTHPGSLGATDLFAQASILTLYDPDRSQVVRRRGRISTWSSFVGEVNVNLAAHRMNKGAGLRILTETITSPTLANQLRTLLAELPSARWHQYEPLARDSMRGGADLAFGERVDTIYRFDQADVVVALDSDFLYSGPARVRYAHDFMSRRRLSEEQTEMNRLYVIESTPSITGSMADHRLPMRAGEIEALAITLARELGVDTGPGEQMTSAESRKWAGAIARDLRSHRGRSIVVAGDSQPAVVHALAHAMNSTLGNVGNTVVHTGAVEAEPVDHLTSLRELVEDMQSGRVDTLVVLGGNPVFTAPADFRFADRLSNVGLRIMLGLYENETSELCHWHIPETHYLESWSDSRAYDGTVSIIQPLIAPLYGGKAKHELLAMLRGQAERSAYDIVREYWSNHYRQTGGPETTAGFERFWEIALHDGVVAATAPSPKRVTLNLSAIRNEVENRRSERGGSGQEHAGTESMEIVFRPDPTILDGRFANNGWLQEVAKPLTKLTWDNAVMISPADAERLGVSSEDVVELRLRDQTVHGPVWILPGQAEGSIMVNLGYGRSRSGNVGTGVGFNPYVLRTSDGLWFDNGLEVVKTGERYPLATTQNHHSMEGRPIVRAGTLEEYRQHPDFAHEMGHTPEEDMTLYPGYKYEGYAWGMAIDLRSCIGCNACVVACQSENNIPIVGKTEVARGREMHWIRIDRYYSGDLDNPETYHQPVPCMHCENAPCEIVCPVGATVHSSEGLNDMVYNRCVGTRYCSNNCPYKVRRFNFLQYADYLTESLKPMRNPNVTVRSRGVMEKCTYCVQRITAARINSEREDREIRDGELRTACQQACPTGAIVFGNVNDPESQVSKLKNLPLNYGLLAEVNTRPRTTYLARLTNPNPELAQENEREG